MHSIFTVYLSSSLLCRLNRGRKGQFDTSIWVDKGVKVSLVSTVYHLDAKIIFLHQQLFKRKHHRYSIAKISLYCTPVDVLTQDNCAQ